MILCFCEEYLGGILVEKAVPLSQARSFQDIHKHSGLYKAVDWVHCSLSVREVVPADRIPEDYFKMSKLLCQAYRLLFKPSVSTEHERSTPCRRLKRLPDAYCKRVYAGMEKCVRLCRPTKVAALDVTENCAADWPGLIRSCQWSA